MLYKHEEIQAPEDLIQTTSTVVLWAGSLSANPQTPKQRQLGACGIRSFLLPLMDVIIRICFSFNLNYAYLRSTD